MKFYKPEANEADLPFNGTDAASKSAAEMCSAGGGAALRGFHGPFGLLVLADKDLQEQTAVYFYFSQSSSSTGAKWAAIFCSDQSRCVPYCTAPHCTGFRLRFDPLLQYFTGEELAVVVRPQGKTHALVRST